MSQEPYDGVVGGKLGDQRPDDWLGDVDSHARAGPRRVAQARQHYTEIDFDSLTVARTGPDKFVLTDGDGTEYRAVGFDPLQAPDPEHQQVHSFTVDDAGFLIFLRKRGEHGKPTSVVHHGVVTSRKVSAGRAA